MAERFIQWRSAKLEELDAISVYQLFRLRQSVFILEQACMYPDIDTLDENAIHLIGTDSEKDLVAYLRILAPGAYFDEPSIGRVVVATAWRGTGIGGLLVEEGLRVVRQHFGDIAVRISAQSHLQALYEDAGFEAVGEVYLEDDIPHKQMLLYSSQAD